MFSTSKHFPMQAEPIRRQFSRPKRGCIQICLAVSMFAGGACEWPQRVGDDSIQPSNPPDNTAISHPPDRQNETNGGITIFNRPLERIAVDFRVHLITAPKGTFQEGSRLWSIARGALPNSDLTLRLASNGFQAAIGRNSDRDALTEFLDGTTGVRLAMDEVTPDIDRPVSVELGPGPEWSSIFLFDRRGKLRGMDLTEPRLRFIMRFEFRSADLRELLVRVTPEVEEPPGPVRWVRDAEGRYREMPEERKQTFPDLEIMAEIPEGGFLVIGPDGRSEGKSLLGRLFFTDERPVKDDKVVETATQPAGDGVTARDRIYIISPIVRFVDSPATPSRTP